MSKKKHLAGSNFSPAGRSGKGAGYYVKELKARYQKKLQRKMFKMLVALVKR